MSLGEPILHQDWQVSPIFSPVGVTGLVSAGMERSYLPWLSIEGRTILQCLVDPWHSQGSVSRLPTRTGCNPTGSRLPPVLLMGNMGFPKGINSSCSIFFSVQLK